MRVANQTDAVQHGSMFTSPYSGRPARSFWRKGVAEETVESITDIYWKKFQIPRHARIATAGSCFAQHIARHLRRAKYRVIDEEPPPAGLAQADMNRFGFGLFSARYANIYVMHQLLQLTLEARGDCVPAEPVWERRGRFFDAQRPSVEPEGFGSREEVIAHRKQHLAAFRRVLETVDIFVFTFGLTEAWIHRESNTVYPTAPGTIAGTYDSALYEFKNYTFGEIYEDFLKFRRLLLQYNPAVKFILTVSPVPLTATASEDHVLSATTYSKSVLRAVAGELSKTFSEIDYFPSYELIATPFSRGALYEDNLREVSSDGVDIAMRHFMREHVEAEYVPASGPEKTIKKAKSVAMKSDDDVVCEDVLLDAFASK